MFFEKEKTRIVSFPILLFVCVFLFCNCNSKTQQANIPTSNILQGEMSRQSFYAYLYNKIVQDDLLRNAYFENTTQKNPKKFFYDNHYFSDTTDNSYETLLHQAQKANLSNLIISTHNCKQGQNCIQEVWFWGENSNKFSPWNNLIEDFDKIADENKTAVAFFCNNGLAKLNKNHSNSTFIFNPDEKITEAESTQLQQSIKSKIHLSPANAISTTDPEGKDILLCFSDANTLFMFKNLLGHLTENGEITNSFVFFDEKGTELSLWINSVSGGMFSIPLNIGKGATFSLPCYSNKTFLKQRLNIVKSLLPAEEQQKAEKDFASLYNGELSEQSFSYLIDSKTRADITIKFSQENYTGTIYFKTVNR